MPAWLRQLFWLFVRLEEMEAETSCSRGSWAATAAWKCPPSPPSPLWDLYDTFFGRFWVALGCLESLGYLTAGWQQQWQWRQLRQWQPWQPSNWPGKRLDSMLMQKMQTAPSLVLPSDFLKIESETPIVTWGLKIRTETGDGYRYGGWRGGRLTMNWLFWSPRVVSPPPNVWVAIYPWTGSLSSLFLFHSAARCLLFYLRL